MDNGQNGGPSSWRETGRGDGGSTAGPHTALAPNRLARLVRRPFFFLERYRLPFVARLHAGDDTIQASTLETLLVPKR